MIVFHGVHASINIAKLFFCRNLHDMMYAMIIFYIFTTSHRKQILDTLNDMVFKKNYGVMYDIKIK